MAVVAGKLVISTELRGVAVILQVQMLRYDLAANMDWMKSSSSARQQAVERDSSTAALRAVWAKLSIMADTVAELLYVTGGGSMAT